MRAILDESLPRPLALELPGHDVETVRGMGWAGLSNGELLRRMMAAGFGALVTADRGIKYPQNVAVARIGVVVLLARGTRTGDLRPLAPAVQHALETRRPGQVVHVGG